MRVARRTALALVLAGASVCAADETAAILLVDAEQPSQVERDAFQEAFAEALQRACAADPLFQPGALTPRKRQLVAGDRRPASPR